MICPYCGYEHTYTNTGKKGTFFTLSVPMIQSADGYGYWDVKETLYACPSCGKTFIEV
jgi:transposase-like protein